VIFPFLASDNHIINICGDVPAHLVPQDNFDHSVEGTTRVVKALLHSHIAVCFEGSGEAGFLFVSLFMKIWW